jgi:hypothetical protein
VTAYHVWISKMLQVTGVGIEGVWLEAVIRQVNAVQECDSR